MAGLRVKSPDRVTAHNREMWERLAKAGHRYTRLSGRLPSTPEGLRRKIDPVEHLNGIKIKGSSVLVLAGGGGWEGIAFAKLGAERVTVLDISPTQLENVVLRAARMNVTVEVEEGDMKDLSRFRRSSFDLVWHMHSLVFVDEPEEVFREVSRVLRKNGLYRMDTMHPVALRMYDGWSRSGWNFTIPYHDKRALPWKGPAVWDDGRVKVEAPTLEFGHTIERIVNGIADAGLHIYRLREYSPVIYKNPKPGTDEHVESVFPVFIEVRAQKH